MEKLKNRENIDPILDMQKSPSITPNPNETNTSPTPKPSDSQGTAQTATADALLAPVNSPINRLGQ